MAYNPTAYGYGNYGYGYNPATGGAPETDGAYNPRYHYAAAQNAGFELTSHEDGQPRTLYVGNLDSSVTEEFICTLFSQIGVVTKTKVIFDTTSDPYAFVEFADHMSAAQSLQAMNHRQLLSREMKVNWATQPGTQQKVDTSKHFHVFVGDLSPEVDNKTLQDAFAPFGTISDVKVIKDPATQKSKGYGFVSYPRREEAERAIEQMNGQWLGRRTIRTNWATRKPNEDGGHTIQSFSKPTYDEVFSQTTPDNTSVYVGNVAPNVSEEEIRSTFRRFGAVVDIRHFKSQGYSFVKFDTKASACRAIVEMNGADLNGQSLKCSWGKSSDATPSNHQIRGGGGDYPYTPTGFPGMPAVAPTGPQAYDPVAAAQFYQYYQYYYQQQGQQQPQPPQ